MKFTGLPLLRIAVFALVLNALWELVQCAVFFDMWGWGFWTNAAWMSAATVIDVGLVLGAIWLASRIAGAKSLLRAGPFALAALVITGGLVGLGIEWLARAAHMWNYGENMPEVAIFGVWVGLTPILQMAALPLMSLLLAVRS